MLTVFIRFSATKVSSNLLGVCGRQAHRLFCETGHVGGPGRSSAGNSILLDEDRLPHNAEPAAAWPATRNAGLSSL